MCCVPVVSGARPKVPANQFEDLLGEANFTSSTKKDEPKTIADMRRKQLEEDMDPDKLKVGIVRHTLRPPSTPVLRPITESQLMFHAGGVAATFSSNAEECYKYTTSMDINNTCYKRLQSLIQNHMRHVRSESAQEQRIVLYKSCE